jgi:hypothetical protein
MKLLESEWFIGLVPFVRRLLLSSLASSLLPSSIFLPSTLGDFSNAKRRHLHPGDAAERARIS